MLIYAIASLVNTFEDTILEKLSETMKNEGGEAVY